MTIKISEEEFVESVKKRLSSVSWRTVSPEHLVSIAYRHFCFLLAAQESGTQAAQEIHRCKTCRFHATDPLLEPCESCDDSNDDWKSMKQNPSFEDGV